MRNVMAALLSQGCYAALPRVGFEPATYVLPVALRRQRRN